MMGVLSHCGALNYRNRQLFTIIYIMRITPLGGQANRAVQLAACAGLPRPGRCSVIPPAANMEPDR